MSDDSKIMPIRGDWSARAVAADCVERIRDGDALMCIWLDGDRCLHFSKTALSAADYAMLSVALSAMASEAALSVLRGEDER